MTSCQNGTTPLPLSPPDFGKLFRDSSLVVCLPRLAEEPVTRIPCQHPISAITTAKNGALINPAAKVRNSIFAATREKNCTNEISKIVDEINAAAASATMSASTVNNGKAITNATKRGTTKIRNGSLPITCNASTS